MRNGGSPIIQHSSESNEWYTPADVIAMAHEVLRGIELDPASCPEANEVVGARRIFTREMDGLSRAWSCRSFFCNPPYGWLDHQGGTSNLAAWTRHGLMQVRSGEAGKGIFVLKAAPSASWFAPLWDHAVCFPYTRINFWRPRGATGAPHDSAIVCLGDEPWLFEDVFKQLGRVVTRVTPDTRKRAAA